MNLNIHEILYTSRNFSHSGNTVSEWIFFTTSDMLVGFKRMKKHAILKVSLQESILIDREPYTCREKLTIKLLYLKVQTKIN